MRSYVVTPRDDLNDKEALSALDDFRKASVKGIRIVQDLSIIRVLDVEIDDQNAMNEAARISAGRLVFEEQQMNFTQDPSP